MDRDTEDAGLVPSHAPAPSLCPMLLPLLWKKTFSLAERASGEALMGEVGCWDPPYLLNHTSPSAGRTMVPSKMETQQERGPPSSFPTMWGSNKSSQSVLRDSDVPPPLGAGGVGFRLAPRVDSRAIHPSQALDRTGGLALEDFG